MTLATYLAAAVVFLLAVTGLAVGLILGRRGLQCSCESTARVMGETGAAPCPKASTCDRRLVDETQLVQAPAMLPNRPDEQQDR
jgi:hypothetical protein